MAVCGMAEESRRCPDCGERTYYNLATRSYLHVLATICPAREDILSGNVWPEEVAS